MIVTATTSVAQGFIGRLFKVLAVDHPYAVLLWLESVMQFRHTVDLRQFTFVVPSQDYIAAAVPSEAWPDVIGEEIQAGLEARDERAAKIAETHLHVSACDGTGCKVVIAARIRKG